jgi:hypothetical protein
MKRDAVYLTKNKKWVTINIYSTKENDTAANKLPCNDRGLT